MKKIFVLLLAFSLIFTLSACGERGEAAVADPAAEAPEAEPSYPPMAQILPPDPVAEGSVSIYDPLNDPFWPAAAEQYTRLTGVPVSLCSSPEEADIRIGDSAAMEAWRSSCLSLSGSAAASLLEGSAYALRAEDGSIIALPLSLEVTGIAVNVELLEKAGYTMERLDGFKALRRFSTSVNDRKEELGFSAWAPMALAEGSGEKLMRLIYNVPMYVEIEESGTFTGKYVGDYNDSHFKDLFTVMLDLGSKSGTEVLSVTDEEALGVFARGEALFSLVTSADVDALAAQGMDLSKLRFIPPWMGMAKEKELGFVADASLYCAVTAPDALRQSAAEDFLYWCLRDEGTRAAFAAAYDGLPFADCACTAPLLIANAELDAAGLRSVPLLSRRIADPQGWDSYFRGQLAYIVKDNVVWRWQVTTWELADIFNGKK